MKYYPGCCGSSAGAPSSGHSEFGFKEGMFVEDISQELTTIICQCFLRMFQ